MGKKKRDNDRTPWKKKKQERGKGVCWGKAGIGRNGCVKEKEEKGGCKSSGSQSREKLVQGGENRSKEAEVYPQGGKGGLVQEEGPGEKGGNSRKKKRKP